MPYYVEHYVVDDPANVIETYGPFATLAEARADVELCRDFGDEWEWEGRIFKADSVSVPLVPSASN